jgi:hypothetical protein
MKQAGDMRDEMTNNSFDDAFERLLAGRPVPAEAAPLMAFADGLRAVATAPGRPSPQLAQMLAAGLPAAATAAAADGRTRPSPAGRKRFRLGVLATGVGFVLAGVTGAGAAGVLPDPIQAPVSSVLEAVTPQEAPDSAEDSSTPVEVPVTEEAATDTGGAPQDGESPAGDPAEFGGNVSGDAQDGGVDGREVSEQARASHAPAAPERPAAERTGPADQADQRPATSPAGPAGPASPPDPQPGRP